jgi:hypothetical protein
MDNFPCLMQETYRINKKAAPLIVWSGFLHFQFAANYLLTKQGPKGNQQALW